MADLNPDKASKAAGIDLTPFYQVFFEEAGENLETMEQKLLNLNIHHAADEELNAIFRCAHSVKGGAATFGFADVAELTHEMETLLDKLRRHELVPTAPMVDVLLASGDALKAQLARHQGKGAAAVDTTELRQAIQTMAQAPARGRTNALAGSVADTQDPRPAALGLAPALLPLEVSALVASDAAVVAGPIRELELTLGPLNDLSLVDNLMDLFEEIADLGKIDALDCGQAADGLRRFRLCTSSNDSDLLDLFSFHIAREHIRLVPLSAGYGFYAGAPGAPKVAPVEPVAAVAAVTLVTTVTPVEPSQPYGFFDNSPGAPGAPDQQATQPAATSAAAAVARRLAATLDKSPAAESSTLRVSVEKVDQLINLVGELVITQAMLAQNSKGMDAALNQQMLAGLADLDRNTRDLQEAVMSIRMIPMSQVFSRFPRMLRDLSSKMGKKLELVQVGDATELDKGLVEKITDPLTHLVRNSCDHGIEMPAERLARNKPEHGTISLIASHQGGSIVIEVRDDGKGLSRNLLLAKARERGLDAPDSMSDQEVHGLIFAPGFSTTHEVSHVSGRGVGMDVVKKNITALGGTVEIDSAEGFGMTVRVRLPLTLAIMDGMSVGVGDECYILPLSSVVESFQVKAGTIRSIGSHGRVVEVRDDYLPVLELGQIFQVPRHVDRGPNPILVVVEAEGGRVALLVDELLGQQQVVVKNIESNYRRVDDISGATIMGDGRVALILDVSSLVQRATHDPALRQPHRHGLLSAH